jgi:hypothetical protein
MADTTPPTSFRLPGDITAALRKMADENGETISDLLRRGALMVLGICPTCGQEWKATGTAHDSPNVSTPA